MAGALHGMQHTNGGAPDENNSIIFTRTNSRFVVS